MKNANEPRRRRRSQAMLSAILRVQLKEPLRESLDSFERQVHAYEDQRGKPTPEEILGATVIAGIDNATVAQNLALNDGTLDTYPKNMNAVRSLVRADVDAMTKGKGKGKKRKGKGMRKEKLQRTRTQYWRRTASVVHGRSENESRSRGPRR